MESLVIHANSKLILEIKLSPTHSSNPCNVPIGYTDSLTHIETSTNSNGKEINLYIDDWQPRFCCSEVNQH